jgi:hypothetical protein
MLKEVYSITESDPVESVGYEKPVTHAEPAVDARREKPGISLVGSIPTSI